MKTLPLHIATAVIAGLIALTAPAHAHATVSVQTDAPTIERSGRDAFSQPWPDLDTDTLQTFLRGRTLFHQSWIIAPAQDQAHDGLGPLYNRLACISCHPKNGRGRAPDTPLERMQSMLVRLSVPGPAGRAPQPHPRYGDQLNEDGVPGVAGEGLAGIVWQYSHIPLADGSVVELRAPQLQFRDLAYGPLDDALTSPRVGPPVFGLGLIDAVADDSLQALADEAKPDGVRGRVNVLIGDDGSRSFGRFGLKANTPSLRAQITGAMIGDLGITSSLHPQENCTAQQAACRQAGSGGSPELTDAQLDQLETYLALVAVPARRHVDDPGVRQGEQQFAAIGCALCHRPQLQTAAQTRYPQLANRRFAPYSDLLLHDMGDGLADGRPDYSAGGRDWRTPPLWGLGRFAEINEHTQLLHDGRARSFEEAILWHGGEAQTARDRYAALPQPQRQTLLEFLASL
ncbi:thiol oxidoreductase [Sinimarinibacterium sp. CAU 1509]|uniref:di-heme oxidoreductase family protein n=1 Tax=Sinimarinibacterium sp. CAU 1509 TaxID=2562283 RepID=UPI0010AB7016|nr:di-heme oxidoredictase family protein [Sinimarinibacterium sp. CAU 1509]TJY62816.1 thiol oxidoreductase [Sinimarinibacterium sp. CAU 1509]